MALGPRGMTTAPASATILAVDDSRTSLAVLGRRLAHLGYRAVLCDTGAEALDLIAGRGFDLVLLDMTMPRLSGLRVLREIRASGDTANLPVIVLTGRGDPAAAVEALAAGADDHLAKPFDFEMLAARIARVLARARQVGELKRANAALDARIATRAIELGEANAMLAVLTRKLDRLSETSVAR